MMTVTITDRPTPVIGLATAKSWLRIGHTTDDTLLEDYIIPAAQQIIEDATGLCLSDETGVKVVISADSNTGYLSLPYAPLIEMTTEDVTVVADDASFTAGVDTEIEYTAGYEECPPALKLLVLHQITWMYENRGDAQKQALNPSIASMVQLYTRNLMI